MDITLGQNLASIVRYIQENSAPGTKLYFDEIPECFFVPSIYFQVPVTSGQRATLRSYGTATIMNMWFMEAKDWDAHMRAEEMRDSIMLGNCEVPVVDKSGQDTGRTLRVTPPETRRVDEGIVQLSFSFKVYFHPEKGVAKVQRLHVAWQEAKKLIDRR
ncbi:hypothetical protein D7Y41_28230 [Anaerotruncus sp. 1XD22-93]|nr:hypothetical protein [Lachnospiraceae bacterium]NBI76581.1 hypothetical protein [Lachnospiraceae bacterium]RKJ79276.1 hypothetical protein D7Y41_28230 [Anaerotruncus sp. 1XD22-93]